MKFRFAFRWPWAKPAVAQFYDLSKSVEDMAAMVGEFAPEFPIRLALPRKPYVNTTPPHEWAPQARGEQE